MATGDSDWDGPVALANLDFSIAIQHTPGRTDRRKWVESVLNRLRAEQPDLPVQVIEDRKREGCWPTYLRSLKAACADSHHLVLQDDVTLCKDFVASVREVIRARPTDVISLFTNSRFVFTARHRREHWIQNSSVPGLAVIWPNELIGEFIEWQNAHIARDCPWDDVRVSMWLIKTLRPAFATVPSLTQHLGYQASLLGFNSRSKVAAWYVGDHRSALGIDWSQGRRSPARDRMNIHAEWWQYFRE